MHAFTARLARADRYCHRRYRHAITARYLRAGAGAVAIDVFASRVTALLDAG